MYGCVPQPTSTSSFGSSCKLPRATATTDGWCVYARFRVARIRLVSSAITSPRDWGSTCGRAPSSNRLITSPAVVTACVVLPGEARSRPHDEVALLAAETPQHATGLALQLVHGPGVPRRDEVVPVRVVLDRVDVEVVERRLVSRVGLRDRHVVEAVPLEEHLPARELELLHDAADDSIVLLPTEGGQVGVGVGVRRDQRRVLGRDQKLVQVGGPAAARGELRDPPVGLVDDHVRPVTETVRRVPLPPGQDGLAPVQRRPEVHRGRARGMEPDRLAGVVDDHHTALAGPLRGSEEQEPARDARLGAENRQPGRVQLGARDERTDARRPRRASPLRPLPRRRPP